MVCGTVWKPISFADTLRSNSVCTGKAVNTANAVTRLKSYCKILLIKGPKNKVKLDSVINNTINRTSKNKADYTEKMDTVQLKLYVSI